MTTGREILTSRSVQNDAGGQSTGTQIWLTEAISTGEAANWLTSQGVQMGQLFPGYSNLYLDAVTYSVQDDGTYRVEGRYSSSRLFVLEQTDKNNRNGSPYFRWYYGWKSRTYDVPVAVKETTKHATASGSTTETVFVPRKRTTQVTNTLMHLEIRLPGTAGISFSQAKTIGSQVEKLHQLQSGSPTKYLFVSGDVRDANTADQFLTYTWEYELPSKGFFPGGTYLGQPKIDYDDSGGTLKLPDVDRNPFEDWVALVGVNGPTFAPYFLSVPKYDTAANGHLTLPGITAGMFA